MDTIGAKIKQIRKDKEMTQEELARKADIPYATLLKIENDTVQNPTINTIKKISSALNISVDDILN